MKFEDEEKFEQLRQKNRLDLLHERADFYKILTTDALPKFDDQVQTLGHFLNCSNK